MRSISGQANFPPVPKKMQDTADNAHRENAKIYIYIYTYKNAWIGGTYDARAIDTFAAIRETVTREAQDSQRSSPVVQSSWRDNSNAVREWEFLY